MTPRFLKALKWASELHRLQRRKGNAESVPGKCPRLIPYVNHLIAVTEILGSVGGIGDEILFRRGKLMTLPIPEF